jgi:hypothetical protein
MAASYRVEGSKDAIPAELDLFMTPPTNSGIESVEWMDYRPISSYSLGVPIEFCVPGTGLHYIDLKRTFLTFEPELVDIHGTSQSSSNNHAVVNNILHSAFSQNEMLLNGKVVSSYTLNYPYKAIMESILMYDASAQNSQMSASGFYRDSPIGSTDPTTPEYLTFTEGSGSTAFKWKKQNPLYNFGLVQRKELLKRKRQVIGTLFSDLFQQDRLLLNGIQLEIKLFPSLDKFALVKKRGSPDYRLKLNNLILRVCKVKLSPQLLLSIETKLESAPAKYPYMRSEVRALSIESRATSYTASNLFQGRVPSRLIVGLVETENYEGSYEKNPFEFMNYITEIAVLVDGVSCPHAPLKPTQVGGEGFFSQFVFLNRENSNFGTISGNVGDDFIPIFGFDLSGQGANSDAFPLIKRGEVSLDMKLQSFDDRRTLIIAAYFPDMYQVDKARNIK